MAARAAAARITGARGQPATAPGQHGQEQCREEQCSTARQQVSSPAHGVGNWPVARAALDYKLL